MLTSSPRSLPLLLFIMAIGAHSTACLPEPLLNSDEGPVDMSTPSPDQSNTPDIGGTPVDAAPDMPEEPDMPAAPMTNPFAGDADALMRGQMLYAANGCSNCHGETGVGALGKALWSETITKGDAYMFDVLTQGIPGTSMPSYASSLTEDQRWEVVTHLQSFAAQ